MSAKITCCLTLFYFSLLASTADAHKLGESYLFLKIYDRAIEGRVEMTLEDLDNAMGLDKNKDGKVNQEELDARIDDVKSYISEGLKLGANESIYPLRYTTHQIMKGNIGQFATVGFIAEGLQQIPDVLDIDYALLFDTDPKHRGLLGIEYNEKTQTLDNTETIALIFSPSRRRQKLDLTRSYDTHGFLAFVGQGIWHIWVGIDHVLFLMALVLPAVLRKEGNHWEPVSSFRPAFINVVKIVSLFTIAHSITLSLAALGIVQLPSRFIESVIAASVVLAAVNNILPISAHRGGLIVFGFGLFHGFGFATVLGHLGLQQRSLILSLLGFNLGVELGQIAIISIAFPTFYILRLLRKFYPYVILKFGSATVMLIALLWLIERAFELDSIIGIF